MMKLSVPIVIAMVLVSGVGIGLAYIATVETSNISMDSTVDVSYCTVDVDPSTGISLSNASSLEHHISPDGTDRSYALTYSGMKGSVPVDGILNVKIMFSCLTVSSGETPGSCILHASLVCTDSHGSTTEYVGSTQIAVSAEGASYSIHGLGPMKQSDSDHSYSLSLYIETDKTCILGTGGLSMEVSAYPLEVSA